MEKSFRIRTNVTRDTILNVNMKQDFDFLEILSLRLGQKDAYRLHSSNYGVIIGRVLANDAFGIPNAKVSVFIERDDSDPTDMSDIYPYTNVMSSGKKGVRYNLLPDYSDDTCYRVVGTFPRKRYVLDDNVQLEVYDKYWKYTSVTNQAGDYMIFGVPTGNQQVHVDIDLSDIGVLSQKPRDFYFKGYNLEAFDSPSQFKESTNLDGLYQIISQNKSVNVYPFWGDPNNGIAAITRCDIQVDYKFEPTCVFMGSIVSDNEGNSIGHKCAPSENSGLNTQLVAGEGTIEMIRKTQDGLIEEYPIQGNALIDANGVWCYQIPMNLDYVGTDEYGNITPTDNPNRGIPTRAQVRFRVSKNESGDEGFSRHTAKYLIPMNPVLDDKEVIPTTKETTGLEMENMYKFGSSTPQSCFRDLYWNNVYSVKNYIPKVQVANRPYSDEFGGLKGANLVEDQNPIPFNKLRVNLPFTFKIICILFTVVMIIIEVINFMIYILMEMKNFCFDIWPIRGICPFFFLPELGCISLDVGASDEENIAFYPGCRCPDSYACQYSNCPTSMEQCDKRSDDHLLKDKVQQSLAHDHDVIKLDFYQDWLNGCLYMPLWFWRKRKKKRFLFWTIARAKSEYCSCDEEYSRLKSYVTCNMVYENNSLKFANTEGDEREHRWHHKRRQWVRYRNGLIKGVENKDGLTAYYYAAFQASDVDQPQMNITQRTEPFKIAVLYATDIILLGNLNEDNIYGIPQFFKALPSTTANIPPIATIREKINTATEGSDAEQDIYEETDSGDTVITTGMDWGWYGDYETPKFKSGLLVDLTCTYAGTRAKSCINVERLSELGVSLDSTYHMQYAHNSNSLKVGTMDSDGFINKLELEDTENRATFATLNHVGFIPQAYQESKGSYDTQVEDETTGYLIPKFKYVYPVDFDGRLNNVMSMYKNDFEQALYDESDESYLTFRLGGEANNDLSKNLDGRVRHFYHTDTNEGLEMPLYNNSYYFYFGINKGNTAIDKFNKLFYSPCFQKNKHPFSMGINAMGKSYCPTTYTKTGDEGKKAYNGYGYIRFTSDDVAEPFSYTLYDSRSAIVVGESGMMMHDFVIGGTIKDDEVIMNDNGVVKFQLEDKAVDNEYGVSGLTNQIYTLAIIDDNGKKVSERIELKMPNISIDYDTVPLGTKFYSTGSTRMDYICSDVTEFYGQVRLKTFSVDGFLYYITAATPLSYDSTADEYKIRLEGVSIGKYENGIPKTGNTAYALLSVGAINSPNVGWVRDCLCDTGNTVYRVNGINAYITPALTHKYWFGTPKPEDEEEAFLKRIPTEEEPYNPNRDALNVIPTLYVYQPNSFTLTISQICKVKEGTIETEKVISENTTSEIAMVSNGVNFNAFLNDMPVKFMLGTLTDSNDATVSNQSNFFNSDFTKMMNPKEKGLSGWYGLHEETTYRWEMSENQVLKRNENMWADFVEYGGDITSSSAKAKILSYKFKSMFSLSKAAYVESQSPSFKFRAQGGKSPILYRDVAPKYRSVTEMRDIYVLADSNTVTGQMNYPNIVGINYMPRRGTSIDDVEVHDDYPGPNFNKWYWSDEGRNKLQGNYFAAFTNNGGYISKTEANEHAKIVRVPTNARVTPADRGVKKLGRNEEGAIVDFWPVYEKDGPKSLPYLRGMFVDRRLDYELTVFAPCMAGSTVTLYKLVNEGGKKVVNPKEKMWKSARISGVTYNGIEMSYDKDYNIVSADTKYYVSDTPTTLYNTFNEAVTVALTKVPEEEAQEGDTRTEDEKKYDKYKKACSMVMHDSDAATTNKRLEYSYNFSKGDVDAKTVYNHEASMIWEEDAYGVQDVVEIKDEHDKVIRVIPKFGEDGLPVYVTGKEPKTGQINKRFYEAMFIGNDIRNFFWSNFNKNRLYTYISGQKVTDSNYVYKYPATLPGLYNDDFNRANVLNNNYPVKRFIDIGNIDAGSSYDLVIKNCSYSIKCGADGDNVISTEVSPGEGIEATTTFENPVTFIPPNNDVTDYANVLYTQRAGITSDGYTKFQTGTLSISFTINSVSNDKFNVYNALPRLIRVMPFIKNTRGNEEYDGITYIKTVTSNGEVCAAGSEYNAIEDLTLKIFGSLSADPWRAMYEDRFDTYVQDGVNHDVMRVRNYETYSSFYFNDNGGKKWLTSDSSEARSIKYYLKNLPAGNASMFALLIERRYMNKQDDGLTKSIKTFEFSEIFDTRPVYIRLVVNEGDILYTYIEKKSLAPTDVTVAPEQQQQSTQPNEMSGEGENFTHVQYMTFELLLPYKENPSERACETFANPSMMSYELKLSNGGPVGDDESSTYYSLKPIETIITPPPKSDDDEDDTPLTTDKKIKLKFMWTQDMGVMADTNWGGGTRCQIIAKTGSNFIYKLADFSLSEPRQDKYTPESKTSTLTVGEKDPTITKITQI